MLTSVKNAARRIQGLRPLLDLISTVRHGTKPFSTSGAFWEDNYATGGDSGGGSYGALAEHKAEVLNAFVSEKSIRSVIEFGCGDGNQLSMAKYPAYLGVDVSAAAVEICKKRFVGDPSKTFLVSDQYAGATADLAMSLDVIYHLVEDTVFDDYMKKLFLAGKRHVIVYSSNWHDEGNHSTKHIRHRKFTDWVDTHASGWRLVETRQNKYAAPYKPEGYTDRIASNADFFFYESQT
jgi:SAM-dependent methyltransferase